MKVLTVLLYIVVGTGLGFWHRSLMVRLNGNHPDIWKRLGREDFTGLLWPLSLHAPIWSWSSIYFFIMKRYKEIDDPQFAQEAARFRIVFIIWTLVCFGTIFLLFWLV
jgi:Na+/proline symporter